MFLDHSLLGDNCDVQFVVEVIIGPVQWVGNNDFHNDVHNDVCMEYESRYKWFDEIFELFRDEASGVNPDVLIELAVELPSSCKVLRTRSGHEGRKSPLVPCTTVAAFVFRHNCDEGEALGALHELVQKAK